MQPITPERIEGPAEGFFGLQGQELIIVGCVIVIPLVLVTLGIVAAWLIARRRPTSAHKCPQCGTEFQD